jgi:alpha-aminoadipic semialdehyde synthase
MEVLQELPHEIVAVPDLPEMAQVTDTQHVVYLVPVSIQDVFQRSDGAGFDRQDFQVHSAHYRSLFAQRVAPYTDAIINCIYWDARFPRLLTKKQVKRMHERNEQRLLLVTDISCDVNGSMEVRIIIMCSLVFSVLYCKGPQT